MIVMQYRGYMSENAPNNDRGVETTGKDRLRLQVFGQAWI